MADKVAVMRSDPVEFGGLNHRVIFWFDLAAAPILDANGVKVVVQKSTELPAEAQALTGSATISAADKAAIDAGDAGFLVSFRQQSSGETNTAFATRMLADHVGIQTNWVAARRAQFALSGRGVS